MVASVLTILVTIITLALMLIRPRGLNEAWFATTGAITLVIARVLPITAPVDAATETADVLVFLAGMMLVTGVVERAGVIDVVAERIADWCGPNTRTLFAAMFVLSAVVTATMSLDITIILITPILFAVTRRRALDPLPFLFACAFVANIGSLVLPVSNLTNLLLVNRLDLQFRDFVATMWFPNLVALGTTYAVMAWLFRGQLRLQPTPPAEARIVPGVANADWRRFVGAVLISVILGLLIAGFAGLPIWIPAIVGAIVLAIGSIVTRRITLTDVVNDLSLPLFVFVIAMTMIVAAINTHILNNVDIPIPNSEAAQILVGMGSAAVASNVINNVPATVIAGELLINVPGDSRDVMAYAALIGANIGPALTTYGSLATMLWLSLIRKRGATVSSARYMRVSLITVPIVLVTTSISLWIVILIR